MSDTLGRLYQPGDEEELVELLSNIFGEWPKFDLTRSKVDHWRWKILDIPSGKNEIALAFKDNKMIGCNHAIYYDIKVGDSIYLGHQGVDYGVHPDYRGMGVSKLLSKVKQSIRKQLGSEINYVYTGNEIIINRYRRQERPLFPHKVVQLVKIKDVDKHLKHVSSDNQFLKKIGYKGITTIRSLLKEKIDYRDYNLKEVTLFDRKFKTFWNDVKDNYHWILARTPEYLNWRYNDPRGGKYRIITATEHDKILGYCISRVNRINQEYPIGQIVDTISHQDHPDLKNAFVRDTLDHFEEENVNVVRSWVIKNHPLHRAFLNHGFIDSGADIHLYYHVDSEAVIDTDLDKFKNASPSQIHFMLGDTDMI
jgi:hypothetical protein